VRFYLPQNHQIVYAVLGLYASIGIYFTMKGKADARAALRATPAPAAPDYHTRESWQRTDARTPRGTHTSQLEALWLPGRAFFRCCCWAAALLA
jgi:hypothetical protein